MEVEKLKEVHKAIRNVLIDYDSKEYGDCIIDEISNAVGIPTTSIYYEEELQLSDKAIEINNKLIAEFMGTEWHKNIDFDFFKDVCIISSSNIPYKFHSSWDWLMPVVEKINLLDDYRYTVYIASMDTRIEDNITGDVVVDINCKHSIDELRKSVYEAVVQFIKNQNN